MQVSITWADGAGKAGEKRIEVFDLADESSFWEAVAKSLGDLPMPFKSPREICRPCRRRWRARSPTLRASSAGRSDWSPRCEESSQATRRRNSTRLLNRPSKPSACKSTWQATLKRLKSCPGSRNACRKR